MSENVIDIEEVLGIRGKKAPEKAPPPDPTEALAPELAFDDIWTDEPEKHQVIPALGIAPGPVHLVTGTWYTGKTLLLMTMGLAVASGTDLFGLYRTQRGSWIHFDHEMGRRHCKRYMQRLRAGMGIPVEELRGHVSPRVLPRLKLTTEKAFDHYVKLLEGRSLCTIDPLRAAAPGQDENKSEFRQWLDMLGEVSDKTNCSIVVLHHGGKPTEGAERRNTGRGSSAIDDATQSKFVLSAKEKGAPMLVSHEKTRELVSPLDDFYLEIDNSTPGAVRLLHRDKEEMSQTQMRRDADAAKREAEAGAEAIAKFFSAHAGRVPGTVDDIRKMIPMRTSTIQLGWALLRTQERLQKTGKGEESAWVLR